MEAAQKELIKQKIESEIASLKKDIISLEESVQPIAPDVSLGRLTRMDAIQQQQMTKANRSTCEVKLRQVKASLELIGKDEYGFCRSCEEPIGYPRLKARPEAPYCLSCQGARES